MTVVAVITVNLFKLQFLAGKDVQILKLRLEFVQKHSVSSVLKLLYYGADIFPGADNIGKQA